jgi:hypothetical protein
MGHHVDLDDMRAKLVTLNSRSVHNEIRTKSERDHNEMKHRNSSQGTGKP